MAKQYWGANQGDTDFATQTGAADLGTAVEVIVDLTKNLSRTDVIILLNQIINRIVSGNWPPA